MGITKPRYGLLRRRGFIIIFHAANVAQNFVI